MPMKLRTKIFISALVLLFLPCVIRLCSSSSSYNTPISENDVSSISLYYDNLGQKKLITSSADISLVFTSLDNAISHGKYNRFPTGGQLFFLVFHLQDGTNWICTFYQTNGDNGYFADGTTRTKLSNLDMKALWHVLSYQEDDAFIDHTLMLPTL